MTLTVTDLFAGFGGYSELEPQPRLLTLAEQMNRQAMLLGLEPMLLPACQEHSAAGRRRGGSTC